MSFWDIFTTKQEAKPKKKGSFWDSFSEPQEVTTPVNPPTPSPIQPNYNNLGLSPTLAGKKLPFDATPVGIVKNTITGLPKAGLNTLNQIGQASFRGYGALGAKIATGDINAQFTPQGEFQKGLYGTDKPVDFTSVGQELTQKNIPILTPAVGAFLSVADAIPGPKIAKNVAKETKDLYKSMTPLERQAGKMSFELPKKQEVYKGEKDITTKILKDLEGKTTVSKQYIQDLAGVDSKTGLPKEMLPVGIKLPESTVFADILKNEGDKINVADFAQKVKAELLPLKRKSVGSPHEGQANLSEELRGNVKSYGENIYESPIKTSADSTHYPGASDSYFGHTRIEDMADNQTRRVIEVQSDLYQKGNLEKEIDKPTLIGNKGNSLEESAKLLKEGKLARNKEISKLQQYNDPTAHFRMIREEIQKASRDGKTKLQFPTGETAMKIEGLGDSTLWAYADDTGRRVMPDEMKVGMSIVENRPDIRGMPGESVIGDEWIITDVLGDGKFKAVSKDAFEESAAIQDLKIKDIPIDRYQDFVSSIQETFDISGKIDTNNPIYKFYEKDVQKYLNKFGGKKVVDDKGVSWIEVPITKEQGKAPVEAFGAFGGFEQDEDGKWTYNPVKGAIGFAGMTAFQRGKKFLNRNEIDQLATQLEIAKETLANHPAKNLIKFTNKKTGELPEVLGREFSGMGKKVSTFGRKGDDIAGELGFADSETARRAVDDYKLGQKRIADMEEQLKEARLAIKTEAMSTVKTADQIKKPTVSKASEPVKPPLAKGGTGELRSLEQVAEESQARVLRDNGIEVPSLIKMIPPSTPVGKKINWIDWWRTPDRVLNKIGLGGEAKLLRTQYEKYVKELPENIQKITDWSKRVPKESGERIFKYLDGKAVDLKDEELKVANEMKEWLVEWADRLNLPKDKRITNYITHIFDDQLVKKEFDEDLAKILKDKIPGEVYDPFLEKRLGAKGYEQDVWKALDAYVKRGTRKVHMDPALEKLEAVAQRLEDSQWTYVKRYIDKVNMRPSEWDNTIDNSIKQSGIEYKLGQRPTAKISRILRQNAFRGMIGGNIGSALRNLSQGINTYAKLGEKYTALGYINLIKNGTKELKDVGVLADNFVQDRTLSSTKKAIEKLDKTLFFLFDTAEKINRGSAYYGAKAKGLKQGMNEQTAIEYAKKLVRDTQFNYGAIDTPNTPLLGSDIGKVFFQFMTYPVKQTEFLIEMAKNKERAGIARYVLGGLAFVYTIGKAMGMEPKEIVPWADYFTGDRKFGTPPSLKFPVEVAKAGLNVPDKYGKNRDLEKKLKDIGNAGWGVIPAGTQIKKTIQGAEAIQKGGSFDKADRKQFDVGGTTPKNVQALMFGKYANPEAKAYFQKLEGKAPKTEADKLIEAKQEKYEESKKQIRPIYDKVQTLIKQGNKEEAQSLVDNLSDEEYEVYKNIKTAEKTKATKKAEEQMFSTVLEVRKLKDSGRIEEAQAIVDSLTDEEYRIYQLAKKKL